jgi:hypothetical protein
MGFAQFDPGGGFHAADWRGRPEGCCWAASGFVASR